MPVLAERSEARATYFLPFTAASFGAGISVNASGLRTNPAARSFRVQPNLMAFSNCFPIAFSEATVRGIETKIEIRGLGPFSGQLSYSNMNGTGRLPVAGGLFLGDETDALLAGTWYVAAAGLAWAIAAE